MQQLDALIIAPELPLGEALRRLDLAGSGALVLCDASRKVVGLLTDGDIRRALLRGVTQDAPSSEVANSGPILGRPGLSGHDALHLMVQRGIDQLPIVDDGGILQDVLLRKNLVADESLRIGSAERLGQVIIQPDRTVADAIAQLDRAGTGALVVCATGRRLDALLTDGDVRRAFLRGMPLDTPCVDIAKRDPFTVRHPLSSSEALRIMTERDINQLPVVDEDGNLYDFLLRRDLAEDNSLELSAVIMAGGFGKRLLPLTEQTPKPMLPVGNQPLLERTINRLRDSGVRDINLTTHHLPENIRQHFGDGGKFGVNLNYAHEEHPLGTAGGLRLLPRPNQPFVVLNGDILTGVSFAEMLSFHKQHQAMLTVGVRKYEVDVPFGVVESENMHVIGLQEKPSFTFFINAGIYLLEPEAYDLIPERERFDMPDLIHLLLRNKQVVVSFPIIEYWLDIGRHEDYQRAQEDCKSGKF
ncbi:MAG: nucleotidyltransferase family protein [Pseudomonadota bacterium]